VHIARRHAGRAPDLLPGRPVVAPEFAFSPNALALR